MGFFCFCCCKSKQLAPSPALLTSTGNFDGTNVGRSLLTKQHEPFSDSDSDCNSQTKTNSVDRQQQLFSHSHVPSIRELHLLLFDFFQQNFWNDIYVKISIIRFLSFVSLTQQRAAKEADEENKKNPGDDEANKDKME